MANTPTSTATAGRVLAGVLTLAAAITTVSTGPSSGWLTGIALAFGVVAYAAMAINILLALRRPLIERLFGPLDRVYILHRAIGTISIALIGLHLILIKVATIVDRGVNTQDNPGPPSILGVLGLIITLISVALAISTRMPYARWQKIHIAITAGFVVLTAHALVSLASWGTMTGPVLAMLVLFAGLGLVSLAIRLIDKARGGIRYTVTDVTARERSVEITLTPAASKTMRAHKAGQFVFLTATVNGHTETHPFTLTAPEGTDQLSILIRDAGDWTHAAQQGIRPGGTIGLEGPFGAFTPAHVRPGSPQVWIAAGSGITPFLATLRTPRTNDAQNVHLIYIARNPLDAPAWQEISSAAEADPRLSLTPVFTGQGQMLDNEMLTEMTRSADPGSAWFVCGPGSLKETIVRHLKNEGVSDDLVHLEEYSWRQSRSSALMAETRRSGEAAGAR